MKSVIFEEYRDTQFPGKVWYLLLLRHRVLGRIWECGDKSQWSSEAYGVLSGYVNSGHTSKNKAAKFLVNVCRRE